MDTLIGIDCGKNVGVAVVDRNQGTIARTWSSAFWDTIARITQEYPRDEVAIIIEDPRKNKPVFVPNLPNAATKMKVAQNIGMVKENTDLMVKGLRYFGYDVLERRPDKDQWQLPTGEIAEGKWSRKECRQITGYDRSPNNEHVRDAIRIVWQELRSPTLDL